MLFLFFSMDAKTAARNSLFIIFFSQGANLLFTLLSGSIPAFIPEVLVVMVCGGIAGGLSGTHLTGKMTNRHVELLFALVLILILAVILFNFLNFAGLL